MSNPASGNAYWYGPSGYAAYYQSQYQIGSYPPPYAMASYAAPGCVSYVPHGYPTTYGQTPVPPPPPPPPPPISDQNEKPPLPEDPPPPPGVNAESPKKNEHVENQTPGAMPMWYKSPSPNKTQVYNYTVPTTCYPNTSSPLVSSVDAATKWNAENAHIICASPSSNIADLTKVTPKPDRSSPVRQQVLAGSNKGPRFPYKNPVLKQCVNNQKDYVNPGTPPNNQWPPDLNAITIEEKDQMEKILKEKLEYIFKNNVKVDWNNESLPMLPCRAIAAALSSANSLQPTISVVRSTAVSLSSENHPDIKSYQCNFYQYGNDRNCFPGTLPHHAEVKANQRIGSRSLREHSQDNNTRSRSRSDTCSSGSSQTSRSSVSPRHRQSRWSGKKRSRSRSRIREIERDSRIRISRDEHESSRGSRGSGKRGRRGRGGAMPHSLETIDISKRGRGAKAVGKRGGRCGEDVGIANRLSERANRFKEHLGGAMSTLASGMSRTVSQINFVDDSADFSVFKIVGTCTELEKKYLRLNKAPEPHEVRPVPILMESLNHVQEKYKAKPDYHWLCEQFKSIRQDLTVQCVEDEFAASVYETHADYALEAGDYEEFNQCQSQLLRLHTEGFGTARQLEFTAYRILYYMFTLDYLGITSILASLRPIHKEHPSIKFALNLRSAWSSGNYIRFFRMFNPSSNSKTEESAINKCRHVVQWFINRERREAVKTILKVFRPVISLSFIAESIGFSSDVDACKKFLVEECNITDEIMQTPDRMDGKLLWSTFCNVPTN